MPSFVIPPDGRSVGTGNPPQDVNELSDMEGLLAAVLAQFAGVPGGSTIPADNAANVTAVASLLGSYTGPGLAPSGDTSGATDPANVQALITLGVKNIRLQPGTFYGNTTVTATAPPAYIDGAGVWATTWNYLGSGPAFRMYITTTYSPGTAAGGGLRGLMIDGTGASAGACGFHIGDIYNLHFDVGVRNFQGTGSKGAWLDNNYWWAEQMHGRIWAEECTSHVVFDNSANTSGSATGSFDRADLDIYLDAKGKGNLVVFQNGALMVDGDLGIYGNTDYGSALYYALTLTGSNGGGYSRIANSRLDIGVECNGTSGTQPGTISFGSGANNTILGCTGIIDFAGNNAFANASNFFESFQFDGPVYGDNDLQSSGPLGAYPYKTGALSNGSTIYNRYAAIAEVTTSSNVTGIILQGFTSDNWRTVYVMNNGSGTITFAASGTSHVANGTTCVIQPNSCCGFIWNNDLALWFPLQ